jgi:hypothetical protein
MIMNEQSLAQSGSDGDAGRNEAAVQSVTVSSHLPENQKRKLTCSATNGEVTNGHGKKSRCLSYQKLQIYFFVTCYFFHFV